MTIKKSDPITLSKPIFIEESFTAPFYSEELQKNIKKAIQWLKKQNKIKQYISYIGRSLYPSDTDFKGMLIEFLNESIQLNQKLIRHYNPKDNMNIYDAVNSCFVCNSECAYQFFHYYLRMFSSEKCYNEAFERVLNKEENLICYFLYEIFIKWFGTLSYFL